MDGFIEFRGSKRIGYVVSLLFIGEIHVFSFFKMAAGRHFEKQEKPTILASIILKINVKYVFRVFLGC